MLAFYASFNKVYGKMRVLAGQTLPGLLNNTQREKLKDY